MDRSDMLTEVRIKQAARCEPESAPRLRGAARSVGRLLWLGAVLASCLAASGCAMRSSPHCNPYAPTSSGRSVVDHIDGFIARGESALDNLDGYLDNTVD